MKVIGLDGRTRNWDLRGHVPLGSEEAGSSGHQRCRKLLAQLFPFEQRLEEVVLPGSESLRADFLLPNSKIMLEIQGVQHTNFVAFFHKTRLGFLLAQHRDRRKAEFCHKNGFVLVELPSHESDTRWTERILGKPT
jgi:hypothetical protein